MNDQTRKVIERARQLVWMVREGKDTSVYKSSFDYAKTLIEMDSKVRRLCEQVEAQQRCLKLVSTVLDDILSRALDADTLPPSDLRAITKLMDEANMLLKDKST